MGSRASICVLLVVIGLGACVPRYSERVVFPLEMRDMSDERTGVSAHNECCTDPMSYVPDTAHLDHTPTRRIRVNFHFMYDEAGRYNIPREDAEAFAMSLYWACNERLADLQAPFLPRGNSFGKTPSRYRLVLTGNGTPGDKGIYYHYDDELYYFVAQGKDRNNYRREVITKYAVGSDTVLNIFLMPHHPDSVASDTYRSAIGGIALGKHTKVAGKLIAGEQGWQYQSTTNHEVGHILGLQHTWAYNDGCDDTPRHPNCWNRNSGGACDSLASNNMMDYNAWQSALSPCQVGLIHRNLAREHMSIRSLLIPNWCRRDTNKTIVIADSVVWYGAKDLESDIVIEDGGSLRIMCRVSMPRAASIRVRPGGKLFLDKARLHNACGDYWRGIITEKLGRREGQVFRNGEVLVEDVSLTVAAD